jgi:acyl-CoA reductase-like NAD-dependent aldehyde dehydrogenase
MVDDSAEYFRKALTWAEACLSAEPDNATARRNLAIAYLKIGHCGMRIAEPDQKPAQERVRLLEEARGALQKSRDSFAALLDEGLMKSDQKSIIEELKQRIDQCDGAIKNLQAGRPTSLPVQNPPGDNQS